MSRKHVADSFITNWRRICLKKEYHSNHIYMYNCLKLSQMTEYILTLHNMPPMLIKPPVLKINIVFSMLTIRERHYFKQFCSTLEKVLYEILKDFFSCCCWFKVVFGYSFFALHWWSFRYLQISRNTAQQCSFSDNNPGKDNCQTLHYCLRWNIAWNIL